MGVVLRDSSGKFLAAGNNVVGECMDIFTTEALALRFGLNLAQIYGCSRLVINSDNSDLIKSMQDGGQFAGPAVAIIHDCYHVSADLTMVWCEHYHRESNSIAHELARMARFSPPSTWFDMAPSAIFPLLVNDTLLVSIE